MNEPTIPPEPESDGWLVIVLNSTPKPRKFLFREMTGWSFRHAGDHMPGILIHFTKEAASERHCDRLHIPWTSIATFSIKNNSEEVADALHEWRKQYGDEF